VFTKPDLDGLLWP